MKTEGRPLKSFSTSQRIRLSALGLQRAQIVELEGTLENSSAWLLAELPPMQDVRDVLSESRKAVDAGIRAAERIMHPSSRAGREAGNRVMAADDGRDPEQDETAEVAYLALLDFIVVLDRALDALPKNQRRETTDLRMFERIDRALTDGFGKEAGIGIPGLPAAGPYQRMRPFNGYPYKNMIKIYYEAMNLPAGKGNPDQAIRNYVASIASHGRRVSSRQRH